jgi:DNA adenine methylase
MSDWIYSYIPKDIDTYVEVFSGAFWVYFNNNFKHVDNVIYNDINRHMANLMSCCKNYKEFIDKLEYEMNEGFLYCKETDEEKRKEFYKKIFYQYKHDDSDNNFLDTPPIKLFDLDAGVKYGFLITSAFNGCHPKKCGFSGYHNGKIKLQALLNKLKKKEMQEKFSRITTFENLDFENLIKKYDSEKSYLYCDPPYYDQKDKRLDWYNVKSEEIFGGSSHERLAKILKETKSKWSLSYYMYENLNMWFPQDKYIWKDRDFFRSSASFSETKSEKGTELLIMNYKYDPVIVEEPKKEVKAKKVKKEPTDKELTKMCMAQSESSLKEDWDDSSGLLEASGLKEVFEIEREVKPTVIEKFDDKDDFWD